MFVFHLVKNSNFFSACLPTRRARLESNGNGDSIFSFLPTNNVFIANYLIKRLIAELY
jgi:hypothetical protein